MFCAPSSMKGSCNRNTIMANNCAPLSVYVFECSDIVFVVVVVATFKGFSKKLIHAVVGVNPTCQ